MSSRMSVLNRFDYSNQDLSDISMPINKLNDDSLIK